MIWGLDMKVLIYIFMIIFAASFIQRISGFAFGVIILCFLPYVLSYTDVVVIVKILMFLICLIVLMTCRKNILWRVALPIIAAMCIFDYVGIYLIKYLGGETLKPYLGLFLACFGVYSLIQKKEALLEPTKVNGCIFGGLAGLCSGLFGAGGPFLVLYMNSIGLNKDNYFATTQGILFFTIISDLMMRVANNLVTQLSIKISLLFIPAVLLGHCAGQFLFKRLSSFQIKKIVNILMVINGIYMFLSNK